MSVTTEILNEYVEIINHFLESKTLGNNLVRLILALPNTKRQEVYYRWNLIEKDADDNKFVDCAIATNADFLITDDAHFKI
ncbi:MAG: putative PIN family toxin of toxin-antitoxin system [Paraglaciecola sp.]